MTQTHQYQVSLRWLGNRGSGTSGYRNYDRTHEVLGTGKTPIPGSSDPAFRGEADRWNPEELLVAALSQCHMLAYLHLASSAGVVVTEYTDTASGTLALDTGGAGHFTSAVLRPVVTVTQPAMRERAQELHDDAHALCFIARSVNFPVAHQPQARVAENG
jgi:organic hydroperoxide reductase OsmC/OhrA